MTTDHPFLPLRALELAAIRCHMAITTKYFDMWQMSSAWTYSESDIAEFAASISRGILLED